MDGTAARVNPQSFIRCAFGLQGICAAPPRALMRVKQLPPVRFPVVYRYLAAVSGC